MRILALALWNGHRQQPAQAVLMLLGLALSIAVVVAIDLSIDSARGAFAATRQALTGGATHRAHAEGAPFDEQVLATLRGLPGVTAAAPVIQQPVLHPSSGRPLQVLALDPLAEARLRPWNAALTGAGGGSAAADASALAAVLGVADALLVGAQDAAALQLSVGDPLGLRAPGGQVRYRVARVLPQEALPPGEDGMLLMDIAAGQRLPGMGGRFTGIDLVLEPGAESAVAAALPAGMSLAATLERDAALAGMSGAFETNLQALALLALLVGVFLVYQTLGFLTLRRRGLVGLLRGLGVARSELGVLLLGEALLLGVLAAALGIALGSALAHLLLDGIARTYGDLYYAVPEARLQPAPATFAKAALLAVAGALVSVLLPLRDALCVPPLANLRQMPLEHLAARRRARTVLPALALFAAGLLLVALGPATLPAAFTAIFMMLAASLGLIPPLAALLLAAIERSAGRWPVLPSWLLASTRMAMSRIGTALAALTLAMATLIGMSTMIHSFRAAVSTWVERSLQADLFVSASGGAWLDEDTAQALGAIDGVQAVSLTRRRPLLAAHGPLVVTGLSLPRAGRAGYELIAGQADLAWREFEAGDAFASEPLANRLGLGVGDRVRIPTTKGERALRIAAIYRDYSSSQGVLTLARERYVALFDDRAVNAIGLYIAPAAVPAVTAALEQRLAADPALILVSASEIRARTLEVFQRTFAITDLLRLLAAAIAVVAVLGGLLALQLERAREYALLRAIGLPARTMARLQLLQAGIVGALAGVLALPIGAALALALVEVINARSFGWSMALRLPWSQLGAALALAVGSALLAGWWPARRLRHASLARSLRELPL